MFDLRLLNYLVGRLRMHVTDSGTLCLKLWLCRNDHGYCFEMPLTSDRSKILEFLGFDTSVRYDSLGQEELFEFLCSSSVLNPAYINYDSFKDCSEIKQHAAFNAFLIAKKYSQGSEDRESAIKALHSAAIKKFGVKDKYEHYERQRVLADAVIDKERALEPVEQDDAARKKWRAEWKRFVAYYGIRAIAAWEQEHLASRWEKFRERSWRSFDCFM
jgi:hypothetical protein